MRREPLNAIAKYAVARWSTPDWRSVTGRVPVTPCGCRGGPELGHASASDSPIGDEHLTSRREEFSSFSDRRLDAAEARAYLDAPVTD